MEPLVNEPKRRGRKRKNQEIHNVSSKQESGPGLKKPPITRTNNAFVGRYVKKEFEGSGIFIGKVIYYDSGLYRVDYEDGDCEDLESDEIREFIVGNDELNGNFLIRKKKLDELVSKKFSGFKKSKVIDNFVEVPPIINTSCCDDNNNEGSTVETDGANVDSDEDSCSDSSEHVKNKDSELEDETSLIPPLQLPPSSGSIGVPEEYVSHLLSVYSFLRSFSITLFLSPFSLDDFVGSLNSGISNTLLDAVYVALLRALKSHLEMLSSDVCEQASKCLRCNDWSLLDLLTWPVYLTNYLIVMGHIKRPEWIDFYADFLNMKYYALHAGKKLMILQILCDDVLDFVELRAEIDMREESEVGIESDATTNSPLEGGPRRFHPKYSKTSACKDQGAMGIIEKSHKLKSTSNIISSAIKDDTDAGDSDMDANSDECRICGMDGTLLCCDGCPSAYHSRCIGVSKLYIPEGSWFCPECNINKIGPTLTIGTSLKGAEIFGTDSYGQLFLGACSHLLVLKASIDTEPCLRYYNQNDIPKVVQALHSSVQHTAMYSGLCKAILQYWKILHNVLSLPERIESSVNKTVDKIDAICPVLFPYPSCMENHTVLLSVEVGNGNFDSSAAEKNVENNDTTCIKTLSKMTQNELPCLQSGDDTATAMVFPLVSNKLYEQSRTESTVSTSDRNSSNECVYMGSFFKSRSYFNNYSHGEFAASAAANLSIVLSEEKGVSETHTLGNPKKVVFANNLLQLKAFSSTAIRFFWPNSEKKTVEVPRERCGWCFSCKSPASSKRACLLNAAALNAIRSAMKILSGLRSIKNGEGSLPIIATYILYMEESLRGLTVGKILSTSYRSDWQKQVEKAPTINELKSLLLELEENIRTIALSAEWIKFVDNGPAESSVAQNAYVSAVQTKKRGPGRRSRKQHAPSEVITDSRLDISSDFTWWRGGKLLKLINQKAILPPSVVKKATRIGGKRKIPGVDYTEGFEVPKSSRRFIWRAMVEMSSNASQLALQARYLDLHVKWSDLRRPEQNLQEGKGPETEASAFRNALIFDKNVSESKITYGVTFRNQKHLPSRVMKNVVLVEQDQDGKDKFWFPETRIPLYLIKEYEMNAEEVMLPSVNKTSKSLSKLQKKQLKVSHRDAFSYLVRKRDNWDKCSCASCQLDVYIRPAVTCSACQGYCHQTCTVSSSMVHGSGEVEFFITCKKCCDANTLRHHETSNDSPTSPLPLPVREYQTTETRSAETSHVAHDSSLSRKNKNKCSWGLIWRRKKSEDKDIEDNGIDFRLNHLLMRGDPVSHGLKPVCQLCENPYNSDLIYIHCEICNSWYHSEAVELKESKLSELVGFKCCKCRRIRSPVCPYGEPTSKRRESSRKKRKRDPKQGGQELMIPMLPKKEDVHMLEVDSDSGNPSNMTGLQKLRVRRHVDGCTGNIIFTDELPIMPSETNSLRSLTTDDSCPAIEWDASNDGFGGDVLFDYEDMEFEPQTYFSFTELLSPEDGGETMDGNNVSIDVLDNVDSLSSFTHERLLEPNDMSCYKEEHDDLDFPLHTDDYLDEIVVCRICSQSEPILDLFCQTCGLLIHSHCSPWGGDTLLGEDDWKCGSCRE